MLTTLDVPEALEKQYEANKQLARGIAEALDGLGEESTLSSDVDLLAHDELAYAYVRESAYFKFYHGDRLMRMYSQGDFVPVGPRYAPGDAKITCDFASEVIFFPAAQLRQELGRNAVLLADWLEYQDTDQAIMYVLCARHMRIDSQPDVRLKRFEAGQVIIREGEASTEVYWLIEGSAEVKSHDVQVGDVGSSEFFGEIGFLLNQRRAASVIATKPCTVQVVDNEEFVELIKNNPQLIMSLAATLASRVVDLNRRVRGSLGRRMKERGGAADEGGV